MNGRRFAVVALAGLGLACGGGDGSTFIRIQVERGTAPEEIARVIAGLRVSAAGAESFGTTVAIEPGALPFRLSYYPGVKAGSLDFRVEGLSVAGQVLAAGGGKVPDVATFGAEILRIALDSPGLPEPAPEPGPDAAPDLPEDADEDIPPDGPDPDGPPPDLPSGDSPPAKLGDPCLGDAGCASGHCVREKMLDALGVCCDKPCAGPCESCTAGKPGVCTPATAGTDPRDRCAVDTANRCGLDGMCDGFGICRNQVVGTSCGAGMCADELTYATPRTCDGGGTCRASSTVDCRPFKCGAAGCKTTCGGDADCAPGKTCSGGSCGLKPNGSMCAGDGECASGKCRQGACCPTDCSGCSSCGVPGSLGACIPATAGTDPNGVCSSDSCHDGACDGTGGCKVLVGTTCASSVCKPTGIDAGRFACTAAGTCTETVTGCMGYVCAAGACKTTCTGPSDCDGTHRCSAGSCVPRYPTGYACFADTDCLTGYCRDGYCCDGGCGGTCRSCAKAQKGGGENGTCGPIAAGIDPDGECGLTYCSGASVGACLAACSGGVCSADCKPAAYCEAGVGGMATCVSRRLPGKDCTTACECTSATCGSYYGDNDMDAHGRPGATSLHCSNTDGTAPSGYATVGDDCCDIDLNTHPYTTKVPWFDAANGCGTYDYDCSTVEEHERTGTYDCSGVCATGCTAKANHPGWDPSDPGCGFSTAWVLDCTQKPIGGCALQCKINSSALTKQRCH